jgi:hypothetical protein
MDDREIQDHIEALVAEEHRLFDSPHEPSRTDAERVRLEEIRVQLDRYWDLLRQRRAREEFGADPESAHLRPGETVEKYWQ